MLEGEDSSVGLLYDPESPERSIFIDSYWGKDDVAMTMRVIMEEGLSEAEAMAIETKLQRIDQVDSCRFISAQHALDDLRKILDWTFPALIPAPCSIAMRLP